MRIQTTMIVFRATQFRPDMTAAANDGQGPQPMAPAGRTNLEFGRIKRSLIYN
jgi:hypothetical protein